EAPLLPSRVALGLGLASLVVGVLALPLTWVPAVGKWAVPVSGFGLILGIVGAGWAAVRRGQGLVFPLAGALVSLLALGLGGAQVLGWLGGREELVKAAPELPPLRDTEPEKKEPSDSV